MLSISSFQQLESVEYCREILEKHTHLCHSKIVSINYLLKRTLDILSCVHTFSI